MTLQQLLGIDLPIIQAPMAGAQGHALAAAVSNAGGLGSLPCALFDPKTLRQELDDLPAVATEAHEQGWVELLRSQQPQGVLPLVQLHFS